jgi:hypothetical protein
MGGRSSAARCHDPWLHLYLESFEMTWTAAVWPDDVLPEDSLVGRMLNPEPVSKLYKLEPPAPVEPMPPLLRAVTVASGQLLDATLGDATPLQCWAAEIEALRDHMALGVDESLRTTLINKGWVDDFNADTLVRLIQRHYSSYLTEQARIAREGVH